MTRKPPIPGASQMTDVNPGAGGLLPCPFCGGGAELRRSDIPRSTGFRAMCEPCGVDITRTASDIVVAETRAATIEAWNRRASSPVAPAGSDGEARWCLPVEAEHLPGCEYPRAPAWLCECPRPRLAARAQPPAGEAKGVRRWDDTAQNFIYDDAPDGGERERVEHLSKVYAEATGYYVQFHAGLSSPSSDLIRKGIRAVLDALRPAEGLGRLQRQDASVPGGDSSEGAIKWQPIKSHDGSKAPVLLIGKYRDGKTWSDVYHGWWQPPYLSVDHSGTGEVTVEGAWARWPHPFPPTHFAHANTPDASLPPASEQAVAGEWVTWSGGENPVGDQVVQRRYRDGIVGAELTTREAQKGWQHDGSANDIIAYRVVTAPDTPSTGTEKGKGSEA